MQIRKKRAAGRADAAGRGTTVPRSYKPMSVPMRLVLAFVAVNAFAGAASLVLFPTGTDAGFFWEFVTPICAAMFGSLYLVAGLLVARAAFGGLWEPARYLAPMVVVFSGLMLVTTYLHLDRFDDGLKLFYWLAVYVVALAAGALFFLQHERGGAAWNVSRRRTPPAVRRVALGVALFAAAFAVVGYAAPGLVMGAWPWELTPLTTRAFISWLGALIVGLLWVSYDPDRGRTRPVAYMLVATSALLASMLLLHTRHVEFELFSLSLFVAGVAGIGLLGAFMLLARGREPERMSHE